MDPARMFKESLTSHPELENSLGHKRTHAVQQSGCVARRAEKSKLELSWVCNDDDCATAAACHAKNASVPRDAAKCF
jgi:hypothetical protein